MELKNKKILLFGSSGLIGTKLSENLEKKNTIYRPKLNTKNNKYINIKSLETDDLKIVLKKKIDIIINLHAQTDISLSSQDLNYDYYHNCQLHYSIIEYYKNLHNKPFYLNVGTATQVGFTNIKTKIPFNYYGLPETIFDFHKQHGENILSLSKKIYKFPSTTLRLTNVYGVGKTYSSKRGVYVKMIENSLKKNFVNIYGDGNFVRDFIYLDDVIKGIILACIKHHKLKNDYYYLCSGKAYSLNDFCKIMKFHLKKIYNQDLSINYKNWPKNTPRINKRSFVGNPIPFNKITGFKINTSLKSGIEKIIKQINK